MALREELAVLEEWKNGDLVVREYTVIKPLPVRDGVTGPMLEVSGVNTGKVYAGNQQQYEFIEYLGGFEDGMAVWRKYLNIKDANGIILH